MRLTILLTACVLQTKSIALALQLEQLALHPDALLQHDSTSNPSAEDEKVQHVADRQDRFAFSAKDRAHLDIYEQIDTSHWKVDGLVALVRGTPDQEGDFEVLVKSKAATSEILDCLEVIVDESNLTIRMSKEYDQSQSKPRLWMDVVLMVRPHLMQSWNSWTTVSTQTLPIVIWPGFQFETWNMTLQSTYGDIICRDTFNFTAHSISVFTEYGRISGVWSLPSAISLETVHGTVDIDLEPKRWSSGPGTKGDLVAKSVSGNIDIRMPFEQEKRSLRNGTTDITTKYGSVHASLIHGAITSISTTYGKIDAILLPYWAFYKFQGVQHNFITTSCHACTTNVRILESIEDLYYKIRPMYFANSTHNVKNGVLKLSYPKDWAGVAEWNVGHGVAAVSGEDFEVLKDNGRSGKLQRRPLGSRMDADVGNGMLEILMEG